MQILDGFFRVKPEIIEFATCMKNIGLRFASSDIFHACSSSNILRYHPQAIQYCISIAKRVTLVYLYHVNRCGHHKKLSIAKLDFAQVCGLSLNFFNNTLRKFYKFSDSPET